jgi:hypothetical protein
MRDVYNMHSLSEQDILHTWEAGLRQRPVERAITILEQAASGYARDEGAMNRLLQLSVGQRDARLTAIRESVFGSRFASYAQCPRCREPLEFTFSTDDIRVAAPGGEHEGQALSFRDEDYAVQARLPNSADLLAIAGCHDVAAARALLLERCIEHAAHQETEIAVSELPDSVIVALGEAVIERDPQAEIRLELACPSCDHSWFAVFDILVFLWQEITAHAKHLLRDVHLLALAYGWTEAEILALSAVRRRLYLEMVTA